MLLVLWPRNLQTSKFFCVFLAFVKMLVTFSWTICDVTEILQIIQLKHHLKHNDLRAWYSLNLRLRAFPV